MLQHPSGDSPAERARYYRDLARNAAADAAKTPLPTLKATYLRSAERWNMLARLMELGNDYAPRKMVRPAATRSSADRASAR